MLSWVEHEKSFITSRPDYQISQIQIFERLAAAVFIQNILTPLSPR